MRIYQLQSYSSTYKSNVNKNVVLFRANSTDNSKKSVAIMAPLMIEGDTQWAQFENDLKKAKQAGVEAVSVDVWWGKVEKDGDQKFDWGYYDKVFKTIKEENLHIVPIMSFHECGGNVGDNVNIPLPEWVWDRVAKLNNTDKQGVMYRNEQGKYIDDVIPIWYDGIMKKEYKEFMQAFRKHYIDSTEYWGIMDELNVSLGPSGELRYPSYGECTDRLGTNCPYPNRGDFVAYSKGARDSYRDYLRSKYDNSIRQLNVAWGADYKSFSQIDTPGKASTNAGKARDFINNEEYIKTQSGQDFIDWYHSSLMKHGEMMLYLAHDVLEEGYSGLPVGMKLPGIHWGMGVENIGDYKNARLPEITAGIISVDPDTLYNSKFTDYGYGDVLDLAAKSNERGKTIFHFTCLEKVDGDGGNPEVNHSLAKQLVNLILKGAKKRNLTVKGENALDWSLGDTNVWNNMKEAMYAGYDGITLLRLGTMTADNSIGHLNDFVNYVKSLAVKTSVRQPEMSLVG